MAEVILRKTRSKGMDKKKEYMEYIKGQIEYFDQKSIK